MLIVRAFGPALAAGCAVVVKLPGQTALTNALFAQAIASVERLPKRVVSILTEDGSRAARAIIASEKVRVISFTGSTATGRKIAAAAAPTLKRLGLELGGKTPLMVFPSADLSVVIPTVVRAATMMNGQYCCTGSRVLVHRDIADEVRAALVDALSRVRLGAWNDPTAELGPLIDPAAADRVDAIVEEAASYGTMLLRGGKVTEGPLAASGAFYRPSLIEVDRTDVRVVQEEIFGPVQTFEIFQDEADAVRKANATEYGLAASVFTGDAMQARRVGRETQVGGFWINTWGTPSEHFEQTAVKQSGYGPLCGPRAIEEFQTLKIYAEQDLTLADA
jgi:acyl-CoA reductase-like NAD-dependent aldehyde dehydrogenase